LAFGSFCRDRDFYRGHASITEAGCVAAVGLIVLVCRGAGDHRAVLYLASFVAGQSFAAIAASILFRRNKETFASIFKDTPVLLMGFALLWAGLFYSQYLVIWYGNIPEEVSFLEKRLSLPTHQYLGLYVLTSLFIIPFIILTPATTIAPIPTIILFILFTIPFAFLLFRQTTTSES